MMHVKVEFKISEKKENLIETTIICWNKFWSNAMLYKNSL